MFIATEVISCLALLIQHACIISPKANLYIARLDQINCIATNFLF